MSEETPSPEIELTTESNPIADKTKKKSSAEIVNKFPEKRIKDLEIKVSEKELELTGLKEQLNDFTIAFDKAKQTPSPSKTPNRTLLDDILQNVCDPFGLFKD